MIDVLPPCRRSVGRDKVVAVVRAIDRMKAELASPLALPELARAAMFSPYYFHRVFRDVTTMTPARFLAALRMAEARRLLLHSRLTVTAISARVGYTSAGSFTTQFTRLVGVPPERFRNLARRVAGEPVGGLLSAAAEASGAPRGDALLIPPDLIAPNGLVVVGLRSCDGVPEPPDSWAMAAARQPVRLVADPNPGEYQARLLVVPPAVTPTDALVDQVPGSYLTGMARVRLSPGPRSPARVSISLRRPGPTDLPVLAVTPLRWLADLAARRPEARLRCRPAA